MKVRTKRAIKHRLSKIKSPEDFVEVFRWAYANTELGNSSPSSCFVEIYQLTPDLKIETALEACEILLRNYGNRKWNYAGD